MIAERVNENSDGGGGGGGGEETENMFIPYSINI